MSGPLCNTSPEFRRTVSTEFSALMQEHGLKFEEQVSFITILQIGLPSFGTMWKEARKSPGRFLLLSRIVSLATFSALVVVSLITDPQGSFYSSDPLASLVLFLGSPLGAGLSGLLLQYILVPIGMLSAAVCFMGMDFILLWAAKNQNVAKLAYWFITTTLVAFLLSPVIAIPVEVLLAGLMALEYVESWGPFLIGAGIVLCVFIVVSAMSLRTFLSSTKPNMVSVEGKYLAIRRCIRRPDTSKPFELDKTQVLMNTEALKRLRLGALARFGNLAVLMISLAVGASHLPIPLIRHDAAAIAAYSLVALLIILSVTVVQVYRLRLGNVMAKAVLESIMVVAVILSLPALLSDAAMAETLIVFLESVVALLYASHVVKKSSEGRPDILGYYYYDSYLRSLSGTDAEAFIRSGLEELRLTLTGR